jgi:hypothetical protein
MPSRIIKTDAQFQALGRLLAGMKRPFTVSWKAGEDRSLDQNALQWKWAGEAASQLGDRLADELQREWKLTIGVPILRAEDDDFRAFYDKALKPLSYEQKRAAMRYVPVTSIMTVPQMSAFMDAVFRQCQEQGIALTVPIERGLQ